MCDRNLVGLIEAASEPHRPAGAVMALPVIEQCAAGIGQHEMQPRLPALEMLDHVEFGGLGQPGKDERGFGGQRRYRQRIEFGLRGSLHIDHRREGQRVQQVFADADMPADQAQLRGGSAAHVEVAVEQAVGAPQACAAAFDIA